MAVGCELLKRGLLQFVRQTNVANSEIVGCKTGALGDSSEHPRSDLFVVVKREDEVRPIDALARAM